MTGSIWLGDNGTGAPASTEVEIVMNIYKLIGDGWILSMTQPFQILTDAKWKKGGNFQRKTHAQQSCKKSQAQQACLRNQNEEIEEP